MSRILFLAIVWLMSGAAEAAQPGLSGNLEVHDPTVIEIDGKYAAFWTGPPGGKYGGQPLVKSSPDLINWTNSGGIDIPIQPWVREKLQYTPGNIWAPSVSKHGDTWYLYYSASTFGLNRSAIGLMTTKALDPDHPGVGWQDQGMVLISKRGDNFNAIDAFRIDTAGGAAWLAFGSWWDGIKMRRIDPVSGLLDPADDKLYSLASRYGDAIEAASILEHDGRFYLFVSFDRCCAGMSSTYRIMVGRADAVTGPYVDAAGKPMLDGAGTELLATSGRFIGPGGQEAFVTSKGEMLAFHYYDGKQGGVSKLQIAPIHWNEGGWPQLDPLPE